jgi:co-chaperonin GroES (HSP10)
MAGSVQKVSMLSSEFQPKKEYILVKPDELEKEEVSESGLVLTLSSHVSSLDRPSIGNVISVGQDISDILEGDTVLWPMSDGLDFEFKDGKFLLLRYASIIGSKKK